MTNRNKFALLLLLFCLIISGLFIIAFNSVSVSKLVEDSWNTKKPLPQARANLGVVTVEGKIYAIGGYTATNQEWWGPYQAGFVDTNERYDPATDKWVTLEPMPTPRASFAIAVYQGKIYCMGGEVLHNPGDYNIYRVTEVYDPVANSWSTKKDVPFEGLGFRVYVVDGELFAIAGCDLFTYDPGADEWNKKTSIPPPDDANNSGFRFDFAVVLDNKIMVYCIYGYDDAWWRSKGAVMIYDTKADVWSEGKTHEEGIYGKSTQSPYGTTVSVTGVCMTTGVYAPARVYIFGLTSGPGQPISTNWVYDPEKDTWSTVNNMPTYREQFGVAVVDDILYVIGGKNAFGYDIYSVNERYIAKGYKDALPPITTKPPNPTPEPTNTLFPTPEPPKIQVELYISEKKSMKMS
ncbi:MAG: hypothetical protein FWH37_07025 [Candidatus Bathyarchaeota archaeon]|nr:hypothetical protein [Candidatus Termiticorpusculum sp.]